uniref:CSON015447 protein n=1 Tax=Culicoides sonorensis TaxID=179676 RepID=A0A336L3Z3_CULSO
MNINQLMEEIRPSIGGLIGLQQGLIDEHSFNQGVNILNGQDSKYFSLQESRLMGLSSHENRLLSLSHDLRANGLLESKIHGQRKSSTTPDDFTNIYSTVTGTLVDSPSHHTPCHTPPNRIMDQSSLPETIV